MDLFGNDRMQTTFGGGEANVAVSLANFGIHSTCVTKLPKHSTEGDCNRIGVAEAEKHFCIDNTQIVC